jgi:hypothetical protein
MELKFDAFISAACDGLERRFYASAAFSPKVNIPCENRLRPEGIPKPGLDVKEKFPLYYPNR